jgi:hypothetical protein
MEIYEAVTKLKCDDDPYYPASVYASRLMEKFEINTVLYLPTVSEHMTIFAYQLKDNYPYVLCVIHTNIATSYDQYDLLNLRPSVFNSIIRDLKIQVHGVLTTDSTGPEIYCIKALWSYLRAGVASVLLLASALHRTSSRSNRLHLMVIQKNSKRTKSWTRLLQGEPDTISESVSSTSTAAVTNHVA